MKKIIYLLLIPFLCACSSIIDQRVDDNYQEMFDKLKELHKEYTNNDYARAMEMASQMMLEASFSEDQGVFTVTPTYKELLENAQNSNRNDSIQLEEYNKQKMFMQRAIPSKILSYAYDTNLYDDKDILLVQAGIVLTATFQNALIKDISAFQGKYIAKKQNKVLFEFFFDVNQPLKSKSKIEIQDWNILDLPNPSLEQLNIDSLSIEWVPTSISLSDGKKYELTEPSLSY